jgi:hypothetical protein
MTPTRKHSGPATYLVTLLALTFAAWSVFTDVARQAEIEGVRIQVAKVAE